MNDHEVKALAAGWEAVEKDTKIAWRLGPSLPLTHPDAIAYLNEGDSLKSAAGVTVTTYEALQVAAVLCACRVICEGLGQTQFRLYRDTGRGRERATEHPLWDLLTVAPNEFQTAFEFREMLTMHAALTGNGYAFINRVDGVVQELLPLQPHMVTIDQDENWNVVYRVSDRRGSIGQWPRSSILHVRNMSWDGYAGLDPVRLARQALGLTIAIDRSQAEFMASEATPRGILTTELAISDEVRRRIQQSWAERYGPNGDGGLALLDSGWKFQPLSPTNVDSQTLEQRKFQIEEIARIFRVFPQMMMQPSAANTYGSVEQFFQAHIIHTLMPWAVRWEQAIRRDLLTEAERKQYYVKADLDDLARATLNDRTSAWDRLIKAGVLTINEVRAYENLNPVPGGDQVMVPLNMTAAGGDPAAAPAQPVSQPQIREQA